MRKRPFRNAVLHWRRLRNVDPLTLHGVRIGTPASGLPRQVRTALFKETYEEHECALAKEILTPQDRVAEIGAGIGLVSLVATRLCGPGAVLSCEANPAMEPIIRANYALNGWTPNLSMTAVTADGRDLAFFKDDNVLSSSAFDRQRDATPITVPSVAINTLIADHRPNVLILDIEGAEVEVLGAADLSAIRAVIVEMHPHIVGPQTIDHLGADLEAAGLKRQAVRHKTHLYAR